MAREELDAVKVFHSIHRIHGDAVTKMDRGFAAVRSIESESTDLLVCTICRRMDADKQANGRALSG